LEVKTLIFISGRDTIMNYAMPLPRFSARKSGAGNRGGAFTHIGRCDGGFWYPWLLLKIFSPTRWLDTQEESKRKLSGYRRWTWGVQDRQIDGLCLSP